MKNEIDKDSEHAFILQQLKISIHKIVELREERSLLRRALIDITRVGFYEPDCNICGEALDMREIALNALRLKKNVDENSIKRGKK